jgi:arginine decarboxylase
VPGQVFSQEILSFMRSLDTPEIHGYRPDLGYRIYIDKALEISGAAMDAQPPGAGIASRSVGGQSVRLPRPAETEDRP